MIPEIIIDEHDDYVYDLTNIGLDGELVIRNNEAYILMSNGYFPINSESDFKMKDDYFILETEGVTFKVSQEQFDIIADLIKSDI